MSRALLDANTSNSILIDCGGRILAVNQVAARRLGRPAGDLLGLCLYDLFPEELAAARKHHADEAIATGKAVRFTDCNADRCFDIVVHPICDAGGEVTRLAVHAADITESRRAEDALRESEERFRQLLEGAADALHLHDTDGRMIEVNQEACVSLGYTREELLKASVFDIVADISPDNLRRLWERVERTGPVNNEALHRRKDGSTFPVEARIAPFEYRGRKLRLVLARDITERRKAEEALRASEEQLRQAQKMEAVGRLAGGIAHDFNNQLTVVLGYSDIVLHMLEHDHPARSAVEEIAKAAERSATVTNHLLSFSRKQILHSTVVEPTRVLADLRMPLSHIIGEDIRLTFALSSGAGAVKTDKGLFEQAIMNLVVNARDAMPHGGELTIETRDLVLDESRAKEYGGMAPGRYVCVSVTDTGVGMDEYTLQHAFDPFFTTKPVSRGTGLGLAMVYGYVKQSGGHIRVSSEVGKGSMFSFCFPAAAGEEAARHISQPDGRGSETILLVEDDDSVRAFAEKVLLRYGYTVIAARTPGDALEKAASAAEPPAILVTDMVMPGMSGIELAQRFASMWPATKVLYITGYVNDTVAGGAADIAREMLIPKPFTPEVLARGIRRALDSAVSPA